MNTNRALLIGAAALAGLKLYKMQQDADRVEIIVKSAIHSIRLDGVFVRLNVTLKNPTNTDFRFTFPFVKLKSATTGQTLASSQADSSEVELKGGEQQELKPVMLQFTYMQLLSLGLEFVKSFREGNAGLSLQAETSTYALLAWGYLRHRVKWLSEITLKKEKSE